MLMLGVAVMLGAALMPGCRRDRQLVEQFDNGPPGGPAGASEGYYWVDPSDRPTPGKNWKPVDFKSLTPEERKRIRGDLAGDGPR